MCRGFGQILTDILIAVGLNAVPFEEMGLSLYRKNKDLIRWGVGDVSDVTL